MINRSKSTIFALLGVAFNLAFAIFSPSDWAWVNATGAAVALCLLLTGYTITVYVEREQLFAETRFVLLDEKEYRQYVWLGLPECDSHIRDYKAAKKLQTMEVYGSSVDAFWFGEIQNTVPPNPMAEPQCWHDGQSVIVRTSFLSWRCVRCGWTFTVLPMMEADDDRPNT